MTCAECHRPIKIPEQRHMVIEREGGRIKAARHAKCAKRRARRERAKAAPSAYEVEHTTKDDMSEEAVKRRTASEEAYAALAGRREQIAQQRAMEDAPGREDDWRDPVTRDVEEMTDEQA